jgi:cytochrome c oxidase cbb3-type subunit 1
MTTVPSFTASADNGDIDRSARYPLAFLIISALSWLVLGGVFALINLLQLTDSTLLADCPWFTFGHMQALQETALVYGWAANAGMAVALWLLARLGASPLRGGNLVLLGGYFWNIAVTLGLIGIAAGEMTSVSLLEMPHYLQPIMLVSFGVMAVPGVLAWTGRKAEVTYATQWYAVAALFLFPWFFSVAQVMLFYVPVRGVLQTIIGAWYVQNVFSLWLAPLALAALYYLVPKLTGRVLPNYEFAIYGFWSLLMFGAWTGGRYLVGGPVPAWVATMAIVSGSLVLFHFIILFVNLRGGFCTKGNLVLKFAAYGLGAYLLSGLIDVVFSMRSLAVVTQFTYFQQAQGQLGLAAFSMIIFGAIYFMAPRLAAAGWPSLGLIRSHYLASIVGFTVLIVSLAVAGWLQGTDLNNAKVPFETIATHVRPWLLAAAAGQALLILGNIALVLNFLRLLITKPSTSANLFRQPPALEASAS